MAWYSKGLMLHVVTEARVMLEEVEKVTWWRLKARVEGTSDHPI